MNSPIPYTTITPLYINGIIRAYDIAPAEGYVLHDHAADDVETDLDGDIVAITRRYSRGSCSCGANYDFTAQTIDVEGTQIAAYGDREFFAVPIESVPDGQVF